MKPHKDSVEVIEGMVQKPTFLSFAPHPACTKTHTCRFYRNQAIQPSSDNDGATAPLASMQQPLLALTFFYFTIVSINTVNDATK